MQTLVITKTKKWLQGFDTYKFGKQTVKFNQNNNNDRNNNMNNNNKYTQTQKTSKQTNQSNTQPDTNAFIYKQTHLPKHTTNPTPLTYLFIPHIQPGIPPPIEHAIGQSNRGVHGAYAFHYSQNKLIESLSL